MTWGDLVADATSALLDTLGSLTDQNWDAPAGTLEWTCRRTAAHIASDLVRYAAQFAGHTSDAYLRFAVTVSDDEAPAELLRIIHGCGHLFAAVVDRSSPTARAWHWGPADASAFAAMGIGEILVHTFDITHGLDHDWRPPPDLAQAVLSRLRIEVPTSVDPATGLLWSTGRIAIAGRDPVDDCVWRAVSP